MNLVIPDMTLDIILETIQAIQELMFAVSFSHFHHPNEFLT